MSALLIFSLGPVQPFIAQARKTRDLWIGSYLLSLLMRSGLEGYPGDILYPVLGSAATGMLASQRDIDLIADVPNKFVAQHGSVKEAVKAAEQTRERIEATWRMLVGQVWVKVFAQEQDKTLKAIWERQTNPTTLFEIYWAIVPDAEDSHTTYGLVYQQTQALLDARKRLRDFAAADEYGEKSTISGERETLHRGGAADEADPRTFWRDIAQRFPDSQLSPAGRERLDAIDVIKRFATNAPLIGSPMPFPSTDTIAAAPFFADVIQQLQELDTADPLARAVISWISYAKPAYSAAPKASPALRQLATSPLSEELLRCDGEALHRESFTSRRLQDTELTPTQVAIFANKGQQAVQEFIQAARAAGMTPPSSYYAILLLDGDHMGQLLSTLTSPDAHRRLSRALSAFAGTDPYMVVEEGALGRVIYAGGDDVLALLPLRGALSAARHLRDRYREALQSISPQATASAGIAIAHRRMPLRLALRAAREAEHAAKERYERDAVAVSLLPRSGGITMVGAHWEYASSMLSGAAANGADPVRTVLAVRDRLRAGVLSPRFVYTVQEEAPVLASLDGAGRRVELARLLRRQRTPDHLAQFPDEALDALAQELVELAAVFDHALPLELSDTVGYDISMEGPRRGMVELAGWLMVAAFLARGEDET